MLSINNVDVRKHLEIFERKRTPDNGRISLMYENAIHYDMYSVYIKDNEGNEYLFDRYIDGVIKAKKWDVQRNIFDVDIDLNPEQFNADSFSGIFYYRAHEFKFNSLKELRGFNVWKLKRLANSENKKFSREKFLYRQRKQEITDAMTVLTSVVRIYREQQGERPFSEILIMNDVAGKLWIYHDDPSRLKKSFAYALIHLWKMVTL